MIGKVGRPMIEVIGIRGIPRSTLPTARVGCRPGEPLAKALLNLFATETSLKTRRC